MSSDTNRPVGGERDLAAVADLLDLCEQAARIVGRGRERFDSDEVYPLAAEALIHRIGEATARLSDQFKGRQPGIPWREIRGMRNLVAHDYGRIDRQILWTTLERDLPAIAERLGSVDRG
jgi:uncharacterized protein with HEPN domain